MEYKEQYKEYILSKEWGIKRKLTFKTLGKKCQRCNKTKSLHIHHKTYINFGNEIIETDLAILCKDCHKKYHAKFKKATIGTTNLFIEKGLFEDKPKQAGKKKGGYKISTLEKEHKKSKLLHNPKTIVLPKEYLIWD